MQLPDLWYALFVLVGALGILTWFLKNYTEKIELMRFCAILGCISMLTLVIWTWTL